MNFRTIFNYFIHRWYLVLLILFLVFGIVFKILTPPSTQSNSLYTFNSIDPASKTTKAEVLAKLGSPIAIKKDSFSDIYQYKSPYFTSPNEVLIKNNIVVGTRERINASDSARYTPLIAELGKEDFITQVPNLEDVFPLHVYLKQGIAIAYSDIGGVVFEIWKFNPMTETEFRSTIGNYVKDSFQHNEPPVIPYTGQSAVPYSSSQPISQ